MNKRRTPNRFASGGIIQPETITPELSPIRDLAPPVDKAEMDRRACVAIITSQIPKALEDMRNERDAQKLGYTASFRRFGDYLMIDMQRTANGYHHEKKFATALNLSKVIRISVESGQDVTTTGCEFGLDRYSVSKMRGGESFADYYARNPPIKTPTGRPFIYTTEMAVLYGTAMFDATYKFDFQQDSYMYVDGVPHSSVDDRLIFHGSESFCVPFGCGDRVLLQVIEALEKGWDKPVLESLTG